MPKLLKLAGCVVLCELVGLAGTPFTTAAIPTWYATLEKPFFSPPNWLFGPVWTVLYLMMGVSLYLIAQHGWKKPKVRTALSYFGLQLVLNLLWSISFFGLRSPVLGLINIVLLWLAILLTIKKFNPLSKTASYMLVPYLAWVSFATLLNAAIWWLNR